MTTTFPGDSETIFTYGAPALKFGTGASDEIGYDLSQYGARADAVRLPLRRDAAIARSPQPPR